MFKPPVPYMLKNIQVLEEEGMSVYQGGIQISRGDAEYQCICEEPELTSQSDQKIVSSEFPQ